METNSQLCAKKENEKKRKEKDQAKKKKEKTETETKQQNNEQREATTRKKTVYTFNLFQYPVFFFFSTELCNLKGKITY